MERFLAFISSLRWQDVVDILLNSYIIFRLYALLRGTNAFRVLVGVAFLWFFQRVAVTLGLIVTSWAIQGITAFAAIIIIVVFRNEIRTILQVKNLKAILWGHPSKTAETPVEIITESVFELARNRIGALIVIPGREDLRETLHSGIPWGGVVSREMIASVFWEGNPVHDGAALIRGNEVAEVGAILPLSRRQDIPSYYGTRHRAALGLAETTDALVIVVSEERGTVSVAKGSEILLMGEKEDLSEALRDHSAIFAGKRPYARREKLELCAAALVSFLLIGTVWFSFTTGQDTLITLDVPIEYLNRDPMLEIVDSSRNAVGLELSGSGPIIRSLRPEQVKVRLDLGNGISGKNTFPITPEAVTLPRGVLLKDIKTPEVKVTMDFLTRKTLPVQVDWTGRLPEDLIISDAILEPERIDVLGGKTILDRISTLYSEKVQVDELERSGTLTLKVVLTPPSLRVAPGSRDRVTVDYTIKKRE